jgi:ribonuclease E
VVIGITEALVAIDVNSGRATKEGSIEQTALITNLEAAEEVARQVRLRDLAGLIVIDFIDMEERRNNTAVEKRMKDKLQTDRARIQVGRISGFGLMEMSRQRLRPGMLEASTQPCIHCHGTGLIRSQDSLGLTILRELEEEGGRERSKEVLIKAPISIANFLINEKREHIGQIELRYGMSVRVEADPFLISPDYVIEKFKTATRVVPVASVTVSSVDIALMEQIDEQVHEDGDDQEYDVVATVEVTSEEEAPKKRRRRRRRRSGRDAEGNEVSNENHTSETSADASSEAASDETAKAPSEDDKPKRRRRTRGGAKGKAVEVDGVAEVVDVVTESVTDEVGADVPVDAAVQAEPLADVLAEKPKRVRKPRKTKAQREAEEAVEAAGDTDTGAETPVEAGVEAVKAAPKPKAKRVRKLAVKKTVAVVEDEPAEAVQKAPVMEPVSESVVEAAPVVEVAAVVKPSPEPEPETPAAPKKRGWWSRG